MINRKFLIIKILILLPALLGWAVYRDLLSSLIFRLAEGVVYILLVVLIIDQRKIPGLFLIILNLIAWIVSSILNSTSLVLLLFFVRSMLLYYVVTAYIATVTCDEKDLVGLFKFIWLVLLIQIPIAIIKIFTLGIGENPLGLCGTSWTTFIFLIGISYAFAFYLYTKQKINLFIMVGFILFGLAGGKRAIVYLFPVILLLLMVFYDYKTIFRPKVLFISAISIFLLFFLAVRFMPSLNPQNKIGGGFSITHLFQFASEYNNARTNRNVALGRTSALEVAFEKLSTNGSRSQLFGEGTGILTKTSVSIFDNRQVVKEQYHIAYGVTALVYLLIQVGIIGSILYFVFILSLGRCSFKLQRLETDNFWGAFHLGTIGVVFTVSFVAFFYDVIHKEPVVMTIVYSLIGISINRYKMFYSSIPHPKIN